MTDAERLHSTYPAHVEIRVFQVAHPIQSSEADRHLELYRSGASFQYLGSQATGLARVKAYEWQTDRDRVVFSLEVRT